MQGSVDHGNSRLVFRYKKQYGIPDHAEVTEEMILHHWELERSLTRKLKDSTPENRWKVFDDCYSRLFSELKWLHELAETKNEIPPEEDFRLWADIIGAEPKRIFEIGSGKGKLIAYLGSLGHECRGSEITAERGKKHVQNMKNITWSNTDGIHLDSFELQNHYDFVISKAVVEHMHPDDMEEHFKGVYRILKPGGKYAFFTVHKFRGPWDVSRVFEKREPMGMHLKEYMIHECVQLLGMAGFFGISFPCHVFSERYRRFFPFVTDEVAWICFLEKILVSMPFKLRARLCRDRRIFPLQNIFLIAKK